MERLDEALRRDDVITPEMRNVSKPWADVCKDNVASDSSIMHVMAQVNNVENVDVQELREQEN